MSDNDPYDDRYGRRGRRRMERELDPDPLTDPWPRRSASGRPPSDPLTDPWPQRSSAPDQPPPDPLTDPWRRESSAPRYGDSGPATKGWGHREESRPRAEDLWRAERAGNSAGQGAAGWTAPSPPQSPDPILDAPRAGGHRREAEHGRGHHREDAGYGDQRPREDYAPRGRRHRRADAGDPPTSARGHEPTDDGPRARRRTAVASLPEEASHERNPWDPQEGEPELEPVAPRVLDFDSVPVRRKRMRGRERAEDGGGRAPGRRRRPAPVEEGGPAERDEGGGDRAPGRRRRPAPVEEGGPAEEETGRFEEGADEEGPTRAGSVPADDGEEGGEADSGRRSRRERGGRGRSSRASGRAVRKQRGRRKRKGVMLVAAAALIAVVGGGGYVLARDYVFPPDFDGEGSGEVEVVVEDGASGAVIAEALEEKGIVASSRAFINALGDHGGDIAPGTYRLRSKMSGEAAVAMLLDPAARISVQVTIREGLRAEKILEELSEKGDLPAEDLSEAYQDGAGLGLPPYAEKGAEGYLFPDTYMIDRDAEAHEILKKMVDRYTAVAEEVDLEQRAEEVGLSPNEVMSLAAIIQAEAGKVEDMPKISEVVYNRLEEGMYLKMDSTCFYAIEEYGIAMNATQQQKCKDSESEYETYFSEGLPAGPIVSPGEHALEAALEPTDDGWLYFVTTDPENNITKFAATEEEFLVLRDEFNRNNASS